ncbi:unnamed protein product [Rhizophagus irregularis]|nr:unnamed protein product [Rhizophagus irregularis]
MQSHFISNKRDTEINELHTHEDNVIIGMELDNENDDTENEEIIGEESSRENPRILFSKEESSEESSEESNEESDEEFSEESSGEYSSDEINEKSDEEFSEESSGEYSNDESSDESSDESNEEPMEDEKIMYFGPGKKVERSQEIWHGNIWKESPRFGCTSIKINGVSYNCGDFVIYRESSNRIGRILAIVEVDGELKLTIQRVLQLIELPGNLQSNNRRERSSREVWLFDRNMENALVEVELQTIIKRVVVTILYTENTIHNHSSVVIREILYKHQGHWKIRNVAYSYRHPSEFAPLEEPETNLPIYKLRGIHPNRELTFR